MTRKKIYLYLSIVGLGILFWKYPQDEIINCPLILAEAEADQLEHIKIYFNHAPEKQSNDIEKILACYIQRAQRYIDAHVYQANFPLLRNAFIEAKKRGVKVRFITDDHYFFSNDYFENFYKHLLQADITVIHHQINGGTNGQSHNKFIIIDGEAVWTGSMNLTYNDLFLNANNVIFIKNSDIALEYQKEFDEIWGDGSKKAIFGKKKSFNTQKNHHLRDIGPITLCFDPTDGCQEEIKKILNTADISIDFALFSFTDDEVGNLLKEMVQKKHIKLRGIFDKPDCTYGEYPKLESISPRDILVRQELSPAPKNLHHKFFIIDSSSDSNAFVITGSKNISKNSEHKNDENTLIIQNRFIAELYTKEFETLLSFQTKALENLCQK